MNKLTITLSIIFILAIVTGGGAVVYSKIRGIRNNNPLNIRRGDDWQGLAPQQTDESFCQFTDAVYGIRAGARILQNYSKRGVNTLEKIISAWAPASENDLASYINDVVNKTGFDRKKIISKNAGDYSALIAAMISHENGFNPYSSDTINKGISLA